MGLFSRRSGGNDTFGPAGNARQERAKRDAPIARHNPRTPDLSNDKPVIVPSEGGRVTRSKRGRR